MYVLLCGGFPQVWEASGHVAGFSDPMVDCKESKLRYRADQLFYGKVLCLIIVLLNPLLLHPRSGGQTALLGCRAQLGVVVEEENLQLLLLTLHYYLYTRYLLKTTTTAATPTPTTRTTATRYTTNSAST